MSIFPAPTDDNGRRLSDRGSQVLTDRRTLGTSPTAIQFAVDIKGFAISVESGTLIVQGVTAAGKTWLDNDAVVDNGDGTVTIAAEAHGFADGASITIGGTTNYDDTYTVLAAGDADNLVVTATYAAETIPATAYATGQRDMQVATNSGFDVPVVAAAHTTVMTAYGSGGSAVINILAWR